MRIIFLILVILHGLIHLLGFVKAFGIREVKELSLLISKPMGLLWLVGTILFLAYAILHYANSKYAWLFGFIAVILSQILIIIYWKDAKFGTLPNILVLVVTILSFAYYNFQHLVEQERTHLLSQSNASKGRMITEKDIASLPEPVKNWLKQSGVIGKPFINIGKVVQQAKMQMKPGQETWMNASALQYTIVDKPAFIWTTEVRMNSLLNFLGRDKFEEGQGEMLIKLNALFSVVNEQGEKINEGSIQRYLGEMVWFPSLALSPYVSWESIDSSSAKATIEYKGTKGSGTFYFNSSGDFIRFSTFRFMGNEDGDKRFEWVLLVEDYKIFEGIKVPALVSATWKLEEEDWTWLKLEVMDIKYNENTLD